MRRLGSLLLALAVCATPAFGQAVSADPPGPFVIDIRGLTLGLPAAEGWTTAVPAGAQVPSRGFGLEAGGHVYFGRWGAATLGTGVALGLARGTATAASDSTPDVTGRATTLAPQLSLNFGHRLGWSYLSAGYGAARVESEATAVGGLPASRSESGWVGAVNLGGGARWFIRERLGVGFDLRWHRLGSRAATSTGPGAPRTTLFQASVGISLR